ncbi:MAG: hypothetical protein KTR16_01185 [Acidiferrobacterales bacterium]|nr:hypothetical protein [Acidiferrobacterales bacterium]
MGMWDFKPWDNDSAADWFGDFMDDTNIRDHWLEGIKQDPLDDADTVRAAASIFVMLGRVYIWPIDHLDQDLELTICQLKKTLECEENKEVPELLEMIQTEIEELESRVQKKPEENKPPSKLWWKIW